MKIPSQYIIQMFYQYAGFPKYKKGTQVYNGCCPSCREGKSWGKKKRLYYMPKEEYLTCHNCQRSWNPINWIMEQSGMSFKDVLSEAEQYDSDDFVINESNNKPLVKVGTLPDDSINLFDHQQVEFYKDNQIVKDVLSVVKKRRLNTAINRPRALYVSLKDFIHKNRLCIPFYNTDGQITYYQTRAIYKKDETDRPKYLSKLHAEKSIFGMHNIDSDFDHLFIFEGPIDSMFVKNGIAMAGISLSEKQEDELKPYIFHSKVWVLDNQLDNKDVKKKLNQLVERGEKIFVWPNKFKDFKDLNEICEKYNLDQISPKFFIDNSFEGVEALMKIN